MSNRDVTLVIEFAEPIFKEYFLKQFDPNKHLNDDFFKETFNHTFPVRTFSDADGKILWNGKWNRKAKSIQEAK